MIRDVYLESSTFAPPPNRFEAGTPAITQAIGLGAAVDYLSALGMDKVQAYEEPNPNPNPYPNPNPSPNP